MKDIRKYPKFTLTQAVDSYSFEDYSFEHSSTGFDNKRFTQVYVLVPDLTKCPLPELEMATFFGYTGRPVAEFEVYQQRDGFHAIIRTQSASSTWVIRDAPDGPRFKNDVRRMMMGAVSTLAWSVLLKKVVNYDHLELKSRIRSDVKSFLNEKLLYHDGALFTEAFLKEIGRTLKRAMNQDIEESLDRVKKEFKFLQSHLDIKDIMQTWEEVLCQIVHDL
jgi:hypothetical protein